MKTETKRYDVQAARAEFPALDQAIHGSPLVYLDNASSAQKPRRMIEETSRFVSEDFANVHRGVHTLSQRATDQFEAVREKVRVVLNAGSTNEIVFTKGCTEGINLVAQSWARPRLRPGDEILITHMEHHSNIVPWHLVAEQTGAIVKAVPMDEIGELDRELFERSLSERTKVFAVVHVSNAIGTINPVKEMIVAAHRVGAVCVVDGAQAGPHVPIDVVDLDADFYTLSCHKMYAPTGVGVLYGKRALLDSMPPYQGGGSMIKSVSVERSTYADLPAKFEPGTPNIIGFVGYGATIDYLASLSGAKENWGRTDWVRSMEMIDAHEQTVRAYGESLLAEIPGVRLYGRAAERAGILSFNVEGVHAHDTGQILDSLGVAVRVGHHCCQPLMAHFGVSSTARASIGLYNDREDMDRLAQAVAQVREAFA